MGGVVLNWFEDPKGLVRPENADHVSQGIGVGKFDLARQKMDTEAWMQALTLVLSLR